MVVVTDILGIVHRQGLKSRNFSETRYASVFRRVDSAELGPLERVRGYDPAR